MNRARGILMRWRFWLLRRSCQAGVVLLFLLGPALGVLEGSLASSRVLETVPMSDPFILLQSLAAGFWPAAEALLGALLVLFFYALLGGRTFCSWVCPVNAVTDLAAWLRRRLGLRKSWRLSRQIRFWLLAATLLLAAVHGALVWELVNPVSQTLRALLFASATGWWLLLTVFLFDLLVAHRGWCGHLCPQDAFYALLGQVTPLRVRARAADCDDCMLCYGVCPEPQVLKPVLKTQAVPWIRSGDCTACGRCVDVCPQQVFRLGFRVGHDRGKENEH